MKIIIYKYYTTGASYINISLNLLLCSKCTFSLLLSLIINFSLHHFHFTNLKSFLHILICTSFLVFLFIIHVSKLSSVNSAPLAIPIIKMTKNFHFLMDIHTFITNHARLFITDIEKDNL